MASPQSEIGRELRVSEMQSFTMVALQEVGTDFAVTTWVIEVGDVYVHFRAGAMSTDFFAVRCGADLQEIADDTHTRIKVFEYLGEA